MRILGFRFEALSTDTTVLGGVHRLALIFAVRSIARIQKLHALSIHQLIAIKAATFKAALGVDTDLRAWIGLLRTVIYILALVLVSRQLVARLAHTGELVWLGGVVLDAKMLTDLIARFRHGFYA